MTARLPMDLHTHSEHSHDAVYPVAAMCEAAAAQGIGVFAVSDHFDVNALDLSFGDLEGALKKSLADIFAAKETFRDRLLLLAGIEVGQPLEKPALAEAFLAGQPFDYVLGALHNAPQRLDPYFLSDCGREEQIGLELELYFHHLLELIRWGRFDCAAHIDYPFRYVGRQADPACDFARWDDRLETVVKAVADKGLALELNTAGLRRTPGYTNPEARWIKRFRELGGEKLCLGSDAHRPQYVGAGIAEGVRIAADAGFKHLCYFVCREPQFLKLADYL